MNSDLSANIFEIKRFAIHDGPGIRTTVFFKGCPLQCLWCHNPEGISPKSEIAFLAHKCVSCRKCASICQCHAIIDNRHIFDKTSCTLCGKCVEVCPTESLTIYGKKMSVSQILDVVMEDRDFYDTSGGGITLSGGECLLQADFCGELLKKCKELGIGTAVDTCGAVPFENFLKVLDYTDIFLYDIKAIDSDIHKKCTSRDNTLILENLKKINELNKNIEIRIPYIPDCNKNQMRKISNFLSTLKNPVKVRILPYHALSHSKYASLNMKDTMPKAVPSNDEMNDITKAMKNWSENKYEIVQ